MPKPDTWFALALSLSVLAQGWLLPSRSPQWLAGVALTALATGALWRMRRLLNAHVDMLLIMGAFGGLGMLLGGWFDGPIPPCHRNPWNPFTGMNAGMLLFGFAPAIPLSRCLHEARSRRLLLPVLLLDALGMWIGMVLAHRQVVSPDPVAAHVVMTAGMLLGMAVTMALRPVLLRSRLLHFSTDGASLHR